MPNNLSRLDKLTLFNHPLNWGVLSMMFLLGGCVTRADIQGIQTDLYTIQKSVESRLGSVKEQTDSVQNSQADLATEIQELNRNLNALQAELQDNRQGMERTALRLDDIEAALSARLDAQIEMLSGSKFAAKPLPSTIFSLADSDFTRGKYEEAIKGFDAYIKQFPKGEKVPEAKYKIASSLENLNQVSKAIAVYDEVVEKYPTHSLSAPALLKKGIANEKLGNSSQAKLIYQKVVTTYPYREEAKLAQERFRALQNQ